MKQENNEIKNLRSLLKQNLISQYQYNFKLKANQLNIKTYKINQDISIIIITFTKQLKTINYENSIYKQRNSTRI